MSKSIITIVSVVVVVLGSVFAYSFLNKGQEDTELNLVSLNPIDNTASFLWVDKKEGETTFYVSGIEMERSSNDNPYFEIIFIIKDIENNNYSSKGFNFSSKIGKFTDTLRVTYNDLTGNDELEVKLKVNTDTVDEGNYFLDVKLNNGTFDIADFNNGVSLRLELEVNEKPPPLKVWVLILFVIIILSLGVWFFLLKKEFFPTFIDEGQIIFPQDRKNDIYISSEFRKVVIGKPQKSNIFKSIFLGKTQCELSEKQHQICIEAVKDKEIDETRYSIVCFPPTKIENGELGYMYHRNNYKFVTGNDIIEFNYNNQFHKKN